VLEAAVAVLVGPPGASQSTDPADEIAMALNTRPKFVASRTLDQVNWSNSILLKGDVAEEVAKLKAQEGGEIQVHGKRRPASDPAQARSHRYATHLAVACTPGHSATRPTSPSLTEAQTDERV
jgi:hypothetical protein